MSRFSLTLPVPSNALRLLASEAKINGTADADAQATCLLEAGFPLTAARFVESLLANARAEAAAAPKRAPRRSRPAHAFVTLPITAKALRLLTAEAKANGISAEAQAVLLLERGFGCAAARAVSCVLNDARANLQPALAAA